MNLKFWKSDEETLERKEARRQSDEARELLRASRSEANRIAQEAHTRLLSQTLRG